MILIEEGIVIDKGEVAREVLRAIRARFVTVYNRIYLDNVDTRININVNNAHINLTVVFTLSVNLHINCPLF